MVLRKKYWNQKKNEGNKEEDGKADDYVGCVKPSKNFHGSKNN